MGKNNSQRTAVLQSAAISPGKGTSLDVLKVVNDWGNGDQRLLPPSPYTSRALKALKYRSISRAFKISSSSNNSSSQDQVLC